jgi:chromosome segregation ATPase
MDRSRHHPQQSNSREELVDKLHGTLSILRRERDELHRAKQLAVERLHLIKEERSTAESNLHTLQQKYDRIVSSHQRDERRNEIVKLQSEVERLGREVRNSAVAFYDAVAQRSAAVFARHSIIRFLFDSYI